MNSEQPIIVGLDIGTTKIAAIAGRKNEFGKLEILGFGRANSNGVQHGMVVMRAIQIFRYRKYMLVLPGTTSKACRPGEISCGKIPKRK
jgi:hypothetical protein